MNKLITLIDTEDHIVSCKVNSEICLMSIVETYHLTEQLFELTYEDICLIKTKMEEGLAWN